MMNMSVHFNTILRYNIGIMRLFFWHQPVDPTSGSGSPWHDMEHTQIRQFEMSFIGRDQFFHPCWHNMNKHWYIQIWKHSMPILWGYSTQSAGDSKPRVCCQSDNIKVNALGLNAIWPEAAQVDTLSADA